MVLRIYNTMTREKEEFEPINEDQVLFYSCGQTVYDDLHIGNARMYSNWDVVTRYLEWKGYNVLHVQNFTDVGHLTDDADQGEDKIEKRAKEEKVNPWVLVEKQIKKYYEDADALNIKRPDIMPRATSVIPKMIDLIKTLLSKGFAYEADGNVYFNTKKFKDYGELARLELDESKAKPRVERDERKKNYSDFALWLKAEKDGEVHVMNWNSPWGKGYPGWHLECSVMTLKFLDDTIDLHAGGVDHIPVHHTNEIAQSEAATGEKFVNYWLHGEFLTINGEKMSKSEGNFFTTRELINEWGAVVVRYALVNAHYRKRVDFTEDLLRNARSNVEKIRRVLYALDEKSEDYGNRGLESERERLRSEFTNVMDDDFNTSQALKAVHDFIKIVNKNLNNLSREGVKESRAVLNELLNLLGLDIEPVEESVNLDELMRVVINVRNRLRSEELYELSDYIRDELEEVGVVLDDEGEETNWRMKS